MKSKKIAVYQDKRTNSIFIRPMEEKDGKFVTKPTSDGKAVSNTISDEELGRLIRQKLEEAD